MHSSNCRICTSSNKAQTKIFSHQDIYIYLFNNVYYKLFNQRIKNLGNTYRNIRPGIDAFTTAFPGRADNALAAAIDFPMMYMSGAPISQAAASAGSMFMNNPNIGKMANVALEQAALSEEEQFLKNAMERKQGIESMLQSIPTRFRETIEENKGVKDETETYVH